MADPGRRQEPFIRDTGIDLLIVTDDRARAVREIEPEIRKGSLSLCRLTGRMRDGRSFRIISPMLAEVITAPERRDMIYKKPCP